MKSRVQNHVMRSRRVQKWTQAAWLQTSFAGGKDRLQGPRGAGRPCRRWQGRCWSRCCSLIRTEGAEEVGTSRWRCWWKVALRGQLLAAFLRDPSTCLMEAPEVWGERERSKMEWELVGKLRVHLVKYIGNPHMSSSDGGGLVTQSCLTLCSPVDCSPPGSSVHGILQARRLEWVAYPFSKGSSRPRNRTGVSWIAGEPRGKPAPAPNHASTHGCQAHSCLSHWTGYDGLSACHAALTPPLHFPRDVQRSWEAHPSYTANCHVAGTGPQASGLPACLLSLIYL